MKTYDAMVTRDGRWWMIEIPERWTYSGSPVGRGRELRQDDGVEETSIDTNSRSGFRLWRGGEQTSVTTPAPQ